MLNNNLLQEGSKKAEHPIFHIIVPRLHPDPVQRRRKVEIFSKVVNDYRAREVTAKVCQIFYCIVFVRGRVLPVKTVVYVLVTIYVV